jgi:hypothetical protein
MCFDSVGVDSGQLLATVALVLQLEPCVVATGFPTVVAAVVVAAAVQVRMGRARPDMPRSLTQCMSVPLEAASSTASSSTAQVSQLACRVLRADTWAYPAKTHVQRLLWAAMSLGRAPLPAPCAMSVAIAIKQG